MATVRIQGSPLMCSRAPAVNLPLVAKMRGELQPGDVVYFNDGSGEAFMKVDSVRVHVGHGAVIAALGHRRSGRPAEWSFNEFSGAVCYCVDREAA